MYILYIKQGCPYCGRVRAFMKKNKIKVELRDKAVKSNEKELIARGGKKQVPYLVDTKAQAEMYESGDIIEYLQTQLDKE